MQIFKLEFYVPKTYLSKVNEAIFAAGAGRIGNYDYCCWQSAEGVGQFRPLPNSNPFLGKTDEVEKVIEYKVELICEERFLDKAIEALIGAHPYETPAYQYWKVNTK